MQTNREDIRVLLKGMLLYMQECQQSSLSGHFVVTSFDRPLCVHKRDPCSALYSWFTIPFAWGCHLFWYELEFCGNHMDIFFKMFTKEKNSKMEGFFNSSLEFYKILGVQVDRALKCIACASSSSKHMIWVSHDSLCCVVKRQKLIQLIETCSTLRTTIKTDVNWSNLFREGLEDFPLGNKQVWRTLCPASSANQQWLGLFNPFISQVYILVPCSYVGHAFSPDFLLQARVNPCT